MHHHRLLHLRLIERACDLERCLISGIGDSNLQPSARNSQIVALSLEISNVCLRPEKLLLETWSHHIITCLQLALSSRKLSI